MVSLGALSFAAPWLLSALAGLPVIWWLLRLLPPAPKRVAFAPVRLLLGLDQSEQTPAHTPWWLLLLRMLIVALLIVGLADPILNASSLLSSRGALVLVIDDGWPSAPDWTSRTRLVDTLLEEADRQDIPVAIVRTTLDAAPGALPSLVSAQDARDKIFALSPKSWLPSRSGTANAHLETVKTLLDSRGLDADVYWLSDGLDYGAGDDFADALSALGRLTVVVPAGGAEAVALGPPELTGDGFLVRALRPDADNLVARELRVRVIGQKAQLLSHTTIALSAGETAGTGLAKLPLDLRNLARRIEISNARSAGGVVLLDDSWQRQRVGLVTVGQEDAQPLLSDIYYLERALSPHAELIKGSMQDVLTQNISTLILADVGQIVGDDKDAVRTWVEAGGTLIRFAGPRLASHSDDLIPVRLREGARALDGSLSWEEPQKIAPFDDASPFTGLDVPEDVAVARQVLAQPGIELGQKTWAQLADGTPLVTGDRLGRGRRVLFHVTANPDWSNLPLSGLFVDMLHRIVSRATTAVPGAQSENVPVSGAARLAKPDRILNGFGELEPATGGLDAIPLQSRKIVVPSAETPPGYYDAGGLVFALNAQPEPFEMTALSPSALFGPVKSYTLQQSVYLQPAVLAAALLLLLGDGVVALFLSGRLQLSRLPVGAVMAAIVVGALWAAVPAQAQSAGSDAAEDFALRATLETPLAYVITGDAAVDRMSHAGLRGLSRALRQRTAMEPPLEPMGVRVDHDELAFFPLLYWPVTSASQPIDEETRAKIDAYLKHGGTILFDTQDYQSSVTGYGASTNNLVLQALLDGLDIPALEPIPEDHVLTKSFYLLQDFPGRWSGGRVWVEAGRQTDTSSVIDATDGVSSIIIGSNDFAAAWAEDSDGRALAAVVPGGERQRELSKRFGVNVVIYVLTGNYKADQVHVPALLERLGQ